MSAWSYLGLAFVALCLLVCWMGRNRHDVRPRKKR